MKRLFCLVIVCLGCSGGAARSDSGPASSGGCMESCMAAVTGGCGAGMDCARWCAAVTAMSDRASCRTQLDAIIACNRTNACTTACDAPFNALSTCLEGAEPCVRRRIQCGDLGGSGPVNECLLSEQEAIMRSCQSQRASLNTCLIGLPDPCNPGDGCLAETSAALMCAM